MHLSVVCPRCESKYQLDAGMRGKRMRCPNPICRAVFEVRDESESPVDPVQFTPPAAAPVDPPPAEPPPVVLKRPEPPRKPVPKPVTPMPVLDFPDDFPGDDEASPEPVTTAIATEAWQPEARDAPPARMAPQPEPVSAPAAEPAPRRRRRAVWVIAAMMLVLAILGGAGYWRVMGTIETSEADAFQKALDQYQKPDYAEASAAFQKLHRDFSDSNNNKKYRFLAELSDVRQSAYARESSEESVKALERMLQLAGVYHGDPLLKEYATDIWQTLSFLANEITEWARREKAPALMPIARRAWSEAKKYPAPAGTSQADRERDLSAKWSDIDQKLTDYGERQHVIAVLRKHLQTPTALGVRDAWALAEKTKRLGDAEIRGLLTELQTAHRAGIQFVPADSAKPRALDEDQLPSLTVTPSLQAARAVKAAAAPVPVLALARGVLYALDPRDGELRWARRVGIDTHVLPLCVPADSITPEVVLVLSSDQRSVSALVLATGAPLWQTPLEGACLGTPVLMERTLLVPTVTGQIEEIEISEGRRLGAYHIGQPLLLGGVRQPGTSRVFFPSDEFCLYEIDATNRVFTNILYTRHAAGSLRGLPAVYPGDKESWLLWCEATGLDQAVVQPYALPIRAAEQKSAQPIARLGGLSSPPWFGPDRWAAMTDTGFLSAWSVRQRGTRDPLLFPALKQDFPVDPSKSPGRCEIVHADADNFWTMTRGRLQRVQSKFSADKGPDYVGSWPQPLALGALLHAAQVRMEPGGQTVLFVTTQSQADPTCLASAVDADSGKVLWQRQLGVMPRQTPIVAGGMILMRGAGGVLRFDPARLGKPLPRWRDVGERLLPTWQDGMQGVLLTGEKSYVRLSWAVRGMKLHIQVGPVAGMEQAKAFETQLPAAIDGRPALKDDFLLIPLTNGIIVRVNLQDGALSNGPDWRTAGAEEQAKGHITILNAQEFVATDGSRGLARFASADGKFYDRRAAMQLSHRITKAPVMVPSADAGKPGLCTLDASETLTLLDSDRLTVLRRWPMPGKVTAGPFVRGGKIGCVVARTRLVWLDPAKDDPIWAYTFANVVGEPHVIDGVLVVADVAGQFLAFDPGSGRPLGPGFTLKANVAPTAAPLPFGPGRALVPLTDGTIMIVPLEKLR